MSDNNDTNNARGKLANEWNWLKNANIDERDREAIREFVEHRRDVEHRSANTLTGVDCTAFLAEGFAPGRSMVA